MILKNFFFSTCRKNLNLKVKSKVESIFLRIPDAVTHNGCKLFNNLPNEIKNEVHFAVFRNKLRFLLSRNESLIKTGQFTAKNYFF